MTGRQLVMLDARRVTRLVADIFVSAGLSRQPAETMADALVEADQGGLHSHGTNLVGLYVERIRAGSVSLSEQAQVVSDNGATIVLDAGNALGHLTGDQAMAMAVDKARQFGVGVCAVRNAFHFGTARRFADAAAAAGCVGIAMCNTRPLMPAPGGAERIVGNNPLAIALPVEGDRPVVLDMATSEVSMGRIRLAAAAGRSISPTWATREDGMPTRDAAEAITGMLLPAGGAKGFGLAFVIDLLCGLLSSGGWGNDVKPLYGDASRPYGCSHLFMALDVAHFAPLSDFRRDVARAAARIRGSEKAPGVTQLRAPGEAAWSRRQEVGDRVHLELSVVRSIIELAHDCGVSTAGLEPATKPGEEVV